MVFIPYVRNARPPSVCRTHPLLYQSRAPRPLNCLHTHQALHKIVQFAFDCDGEGAVNLPMFMMLLLREVDMGKSFHNAVAIPDVSATDGNHEPFILAQDVYSDGVMVYQLLFMTLSKK